MAVTSENLTSFNNCVVWTCFGHFRILRSLTWMSGGRKPTSFYLCLFQDMHCPHLFKLGAKLQACQESVSDPSDLVHSLKV